MYYQRADVEWMPITDIAPNEVRLAWTSGRHDPLISEFIEPGHAAVFDAPADFAQVILDATRT